MSEYWKPEWQRGSIVLSGQVGPEDLEALQHQVEKQGNALGYELPEGFEARPVPNADGLIRMAVVGPDYAVLVSAAERTRAADLQERIGRLTFYFICSRPGVWPIPDECRLEGERLELALNLLLDDGSTARIDLERSVHEAVTGIDFVGAGGRVMNLSNEAGEVAAYDLGLVAQAALASQPLQPSPLDLEVHYIGRARGVIEQTCALDRLKRHEQYQQVLETITESPYRNRDVWLILGSGTSINLVSGHEDPSVKVDEIANGDVRARRALGEADRIDLSEALLINYFKPALNEHHVKKLDLAGATLVKAREAGLTGVTLVFETASLGLAIYTEHIPARLHHAMSVAL